MLVGGIGGRGGGGWGGKGGWMAADFGCLAGELWSVVLTNGGCSVDGGDFYFFIF